MVWYAVVFAVFASGNDRNSGKYRDALYELGGYRLTRTPELLDILEINADLYIILISHLIRPPNPLTPPSSNGVDEYTPVGEGKEEIKKERKRTDNSTFSVQSSTTVSRFSVSFFPSLSSSLHPSSLTFLLSPFLSQAQHITSSL